MGLAPDVVPRKMVSLYGYWKQVPMTNQQKALALELFAGTAFVLAANTISLALALTLMGLFALLAAWTISQNRS